MAPHHVNNEELGRRGQELYDETIRAKVEGREDGKIVAIDVETGDYEIDEHVLPAVHRIRARHPDAAVFTTRVGYNGVYEFGGCSRRVKR